MSFREPSASEVEKWKESFNHVMSSESECFPGMFDLNQANVNTTRLSVLHLILQRLASSRALTAHMKNEGALWADCSVIMEKLALAAVTPNILCTSDVFLFLFTFSLLLRTNGTLLVIGERQA